MIKDKKEMAEQACIDAELLDDLAGWLRAYEFEVLACGRDGDIEMDKAKHRAGSAIKALVNYL